MKPKIILSLLTLMLCVSVFCVPALAAAEPDNGRLSISTAWASGELLHIEVLDNQTGAVSAIELRLSDYSGNAETITIQAVDADGNKSGVITITNPYYTADDGDMPHADNTPTESAIPDGSNPFTPDGTGGVVDNATEQDGKEFFTITTENDNTFYLIVDRQKSAENVYLLNAVTENDLMALAAKGDGQRDAGPNAAHGAGQESAIPTPAPEPTPEPEPEPQPEQKERGVNGNLIIIILAVVIVGGAGYYLKIVKPKRNAPDDYESYFEDDSDAPEDEEREEDTE